MPVNHALVGERKMRENRNGSMVVDGKALAEFLLSDLSAKVKKYKEIGITPTIAVILVGDDPGSLSYIAQKRKAAERIGARLIFEHLGASVSPEQLASSVERFNDDDTVHGLIIQRPVPLFVNELGSILGSVRPDKDIDGFLPNSPFEVPVARGVMTILNHIHGHLRSRKLIRDDFMPWLRAQAVAVVGRGETAGAPIASLLQKYGCTVSVVHTKTPNPKQVLKQASIIASCVGKRRIVTRPVIRPGVILISVGLARTDEGKLKGDYDEEEIADTASFYTPTPGGVGPVNVASLMQNLLDACALQQNSR